MVLLVILIKAMGRRTSGLKDNMRSSKSRSRSKTNRPRTLGNIINRVFDSSGPDGKVRGTPAQLIEKYQFLARDAQLSNDRVAAENFLQHAEHYTRLLAEANRELAAEQESRQQTYPQNGQPRERGQGEYRPDYRPDYRDDRGDEQPDVPGHDMVEMIGYDEGGLVETPETTQRDPRHDRNHDQRPPRNDDYRRPQNGQRNDGQRNDGQRNDNQRNDVQRNDNQRADNQRADGSRHEGQRRPYPPRVDQNRTDGRGNDQPRQDRPYQDRGPQQDRVQHQERAPQQERVVYDRPIQERPAEAPRYDAPQPEPQPLAPIVFGVTPPAPPPTAPLEAVAAPKKTRAPSTRTKAVAKRAGTQHEIQDSIRASTPRH